MNIQGIRSTVQLTGALKCKIETHALTGREVTARWTGEGIILGKRAGVDARERFAFVIQHDEVVRFISRASFTLLDPSEGLETFDTFSLAFNYCREADRPVTVLVAGEGWKLFPSGRAERKSALDKKEQS